MNIGPQDSPTNIVYIFKTYLGEKIDSKFCNVASKHDIFVVLL